MEETSRYGGARRREGSRGLSKVPAEKGDQQDRVGVKERETKRIAKGTSRKGGPGGFRGFEGKRDPGG
jgi:hypothetical protein